MASALSSRDAPLEPVADDKGGPVEKLVFEEEERLSAGPKEDCFLFSILHPPKPLPRHTPKLLADASTDTTVAVVDRAVGPARMQVNAGTVYEYQSLTAGQAQRALNNARLIAFLKEALPVMEHELEECRLFERIL